MTIHTTYSQARANFAPLRDQVTDDREVVIIRRCGAAHVALVVADELADLLENGIGKPELPRFLGAGV